MSFLKIKDPAKRDALVAEYLKTKKNIRQQDIQRRIGEQDTFEDLTRQYKPIIEAQKEGTRAILDTILPAIPMLEQPVGLPRLMFGEDPQDDYVPPPVMTIGPIATEYLGKLTNKATADGTYGIRNKENKYYIGDSEVKFNGNDLIVGGQRYGGTQWSLGTHRSKGTT